MHESHRRLFAEVDGDEDQRRDAQDIGGDGDGQHRGKKHRCAHLARRSGEVRVEESQREEAEDRVQAGARVRHQHLGIAEQEHHAAALDRISEREEHRFHRHRDQRLERRGRGVEDEARDGYEEEKEEEREGQAAQRLEAADEKHEAREHRDVRADLDGRESEGSAADVEEKPEGKRDGAREGRGAAGRDERVALAPREPGEGREDDGPVRVRVVAPEALGERHVCGHVEGREPQRERKPGLPARPRFGQATLLEDRVHAGLSTG